MNNKKQFFDDFANQAFDKSAETFQLLSTDEQQVVLKQLYYEAREAKTPIALGVLYRELHDDKTFDDFYNAWMPPEDSMQPFTIGDKTYYHHFDMPTRVINAVNIEDPKEIISVGMVWGSQEELLQNLEKSTQSKSNKARADNISSVADKISAKQYFVQSDTNLGT